MHIRHREYSQMAYEIGPSTQIRTDLCVIVIFSFFRGFIKTLWDFYFVIVTRTGTGIIDTYLEYQYLHF